MGKDILVFAEVRDGSIKKVTYELVSAARRLAEKNGGQIHACVVGSDPAQAAAEMAKFVSGKVFTAASPALERYSPQGYAKALAAIVETSDPAVVLFGATAMGKDLSARLAAKLRAALFTDCTELDLEGDRLKVVRPVYSGKVYAEAVAKGDCLQMASVRPNTFPAASPGEGQAEVQAVDVSVDAGELGAIVKEIAAVSGGRKDVTEAEVIVSGGRAMKSAENFKLLEELADVLGGSVGASRAAVDAGYAPHSIQVGQTGKVVNPKLYIACGISGAIQHLVGMRTSKVIVAINKDPNAPIFQKADYGIVGDLFEIVPMLTEELRKVLSS
jgi:electron transfer flavoprotein alpha subunit